MVTDGCCCAPDRTPSGCCTPRWVPDRSRDGCCTPRWVPDRTPPVVAPHDGGLWVPPVAGVPGVPTQPPAHTRRAPTDPRPRCPGSSRAKGPSRCASGVIWWILLYFKMFYSCPWGLKTRRNAGKRGFRTKNARLPRRGAGFAGAGTVWGVKRRFWRFFPEEMGKFGF